MQGIYERRIGKKKTKKFILINKETYLKDFFNLFTFTFGKINSNDFFDVFKVGSDTISGFFSYLFNAKRERPINVMDILYARWKLCFLCASSTLIVSGI